MIFKSWINKELNDKEFYQVITALRGPDNSMASSGLKRYTTAYLRWLVFSTQLKGTFHLWGGTINDNATLGATKLVETIQENIASLRKSQPKAKSLRLETASWAKTANASRLKSKKVIGFYSENMVERR